MIEQFCLKILSASLHALLLKILSIVISYFIGVPYSPILPANCNFMWISLLPFPFYAIDHFYILCGLCEMKGSIIS
ncbi:hypothetical protein AMTRI_Chr12g274890 [Amborella trichopoda]